MEKTCATCWFWRMYKPHPTKPDLNKGVCGMFPGNNTYAKAGCGEHQPKDTPND